MSPRLLLSPQQLNHTLNRLAWQVGEHYGDFANAAIIGIQPRGTDLSKRMAQRIRGFFPAAKFHYGEIDITLHRDDIGRSAELRLPSETRLDFNIDGKRVLLIDDVLFTGRTVRSAIEALLPFGRPASVELLVLIDRRFSRQLPVQPNFTGCTVDVIASEKVKVEWEVEGGKVSLYQSTANG